MFFDHQVHGAHIFPQFLTAFKAVHTGILSAVLVDARILVEDVDHLKVVVLADGVIVGVVGGCDLERAGTEGAVDIFIRNHGNAPAQDGHQHVLADVLLVAFVLGVDGYGSIAQNGFRAGGCHGDVFAGQVGQHVFEIIQETGLF